MHSWLAIFASFCLFAAMPALALPSITEQKALLNEIANTLPLDMTDLKWDKPETGKTPTYIPETNTISVCTTCDDKLSIAIFTHEYAHAIFEKYMLGADQTWAQIRNRAANDEIGKEINASYDELNREQDREKRILLEEKFKTLAEEERILKAKQYFMSSYHEFFADSLTTIIFQDTTAMQSAIASLGLVSTQDEHLSLQWRSFENCMSDSEKEIWIEQITRIHGLAGRYNSYDLLAPARGCLGPIFLQKIQNISELKSYLPKFLEVLQQDFANRINSIDENITLLDPNEMNKTLEDKIIKLFNP